MDEDLKLIKEVLKGNVDSFSILMNKYEHMVFSFAYNMINDREAAQDVTQEVFIIVYNKLYMYDKKYKFKNWLLKIARNKCIDYIRKYKRVYEANIEDITYIYDKNPGPEEAMEIREAKLIIRDFIGKLGDIDRQIITLKYSSGTTFVDIGEVMGMTEGAVKRRIMDMGLTKGTEVYVRKVAPLGDPIELNVRGYELSIRKADAQMIEVN